MPQTGTDISQQRIESYARESSGLPEDDVVAAFDLMTVCALRSG